MNEKNILKNSMRYLTLTDIKKQCVIDEDFHDDDLFLDSIGNSAEDYVEQMYHSAP